MNKILAAEAVGTRREAWRVVPDMVCVLHAVTGVYAIELSVSIFLFKKASYSRYYLDISILNLFNNNTFKAI